MVTFPSAFKLLRNANVTKEQKLLVLKGRNYGNKATLYDKANKSLKTIIHVDSQRGVHSLYRWIGRFNNRMRGRPWAERNINQMANKRQSTRTSLVA